MSRKSSLCVVLALLAVGTLLVGSVSAGPIGPITVPDFSFETPGVDDGVSTAGAPPGWGSNIGDWAATYNPLADAITSGVDGSNVFCFYGDSGSWGEIYSPSLGAVQAGTYTLTVAVGANAGTASQDALLTFGTDLHWDVAVNTIAAADVPLGYLSDKTVTWTVPIDSPYLGQQLQIGLAGVSNAAGAYANFDNIRLTGPVSTPEPGTLMILASGLIGLLCYAWRKRK
jgi:hypothetical protein